MLVGLLGGVKLEYLKSENVTENGINFINVYKFKERGDIAHVEEVEYDDIRYFVFKGSNPILAKFWSSASFKLDLASVDYQVKPILSYTNITFFAFQSFYIHFTLILRFKIRVFF